MRKAKPGIQAASAEPEPEAVGRLFRCMGCYKQFPEEALTTVEETWYSKGFRCAPCARDFETRKALGL